MLTNITDNIIHSYTPFKAMLFYVRAYEEKDTGIENSFYVESYDIGRNGTPINAHPLSLRESNQFAELLSSEKKAKSTFLKSEGILPDNLLYLNTDKEGFAIWHTPPMERQLFFIDSLGIPSETVKLPAMVWKAGREASACSPSGEAGNR